MVLLFPQRDVPVLQTAFMHARNEVTLKRVAKFMASTCTRFPLSVMAPFLVNLPDAF